MKNNDEIIGVIERENYVIEIRAYDIPESNIDNVYRTLAQLLYEQILKDSSMGVGK